MWFRKNLLNDLVSRNLKSIHCKPNKKNIIWEMAIQKVPQQRAGQSAQEEQALPLSAEPAWRWRSHGPGSRPSPIGLLQAGRLGNSHLPLEMQPKVAASEKLFESPLFCPSGRRGQQPCSLLWAADGPCNTRSVLSPVTLTVFPSRRRDLGGIGSV